MFFSRQIGLQSGSVVPIIAGGRVTGKVGPFDVGALNIQTDDERAAGAMSTNFTVVRLKRDILRQQRRVNGAFAVQVGHFWSGDIRAVEYRNGRIEVLEQFSIEPSISFNWLDLPEGSFRTELVRTRLNYSLTPRTFLSGLLQYNSSNDTFSTNFRLRWEYSPGSELFVVYTEDRDTDPFLPAQFSLLRNRGFVVKLTRLFRL